MLLRLLPKYKKPRCRVSIFLLLLKKNPFLHLLLLLLHLLSRVYSLHEVETTNKNYWRIFKMSLPRSVICLQVHFLMRLEDMNQNFLHKDREAIQMPDMLVCGKRLQHYSTNVTDAISSVMSGFITELLILAAFCFHCWN